MEKREQRAQRMKEVPMGIVRLSSSFNGRSSKREMRKAVNNDVTVSEN